MSDRKSFDYIVVGAGTAGCVVASRLADTGQSVLLLEQGSDGTAPTIEAADLASVFALWQDQNQIVNFPMNPRSTSTTRWPVLMRGRTVGGSGAVNVMIHTRANRMDLDGWAAMGNSGWSYDDLLPYYRMSETDPEGETDWHGGSGPIQLSLPTPSAYSEALEQAAVELGFGTSDWDLNGPNQSGGPGRYRFAMDRRGKRSSTASAYLRPAQHRHPRSLEVRAGAPALRIAISEHEGRKRATGVVCRNPDSWFEEVITATQRVIVCGGAVESPKLLMLSGIGPGEQLKQLGIEVTASLNGVGQNLQDHVITSVQFKGNAPIPKPQFLTEAGLFAYVPSTPGNIHYTADRHPTVQFFLNAGVPGRGFPWAPDDFFAISPSLTRPETTGDIQLASKDPRRAPIIQLDYLSNGNDLDTLVNAVLLAVEMGETKALQPLNGGVLSILTKTGLVPLGKETPRDKIAEYLLMTARGLWHPACTCAMGQNPNRGAVVDSSLNVHGVAGLSVCDASIFPRMICGNLNATVIAVAEKFCGELISAS